MSVHVTLAGHEIPCVDTSRTPVRLDKPASPAENVGRPRECSECDVTWHDDREGCPCGQLAF